MSDLFGLLPLPAPVPAAGAAATDPALDVLLDFMRAVLNADLGDAWAALAPADASPAAYAFNHNPDLENLNTNELPALFLWRPDETAKERYSQDLVADEAGFSALWVPPPASQDQAEAREGFRNGVKKCLRRAFALGRHPAWVVAGDAAVPGVDSKDPAEYGSLVLRKAGLAKAVVGQFQAHKLVLGSDADKGYKQTFDCLFFTVSAVEFLSWDPAEYGVPFDHAEGSLKLPDRASPETGAALDVLDFHLEPALTSISPGTGSAAGGQVVTLSGAQLQDGMQVTFGSSSQSPAVSPLVELADESTASVTTPAHAAGAVDVVVLFPSGATKTLAAAFTFS